MRSSLSHNPENLPEELRRWADNRERLNLDPTLLREAADEIDQLRSEIDRLVETHAEELTRLDWTQHRQQTLTVEGVAFPPDKAPKIGDQLDVTVPWTGRGVTTTVILVERTGKKEVRWVAEAHP